MRTNSLVSELMLKYPVEGEEVRVVVDDHSFPVSEIRFDNNSRRVYLLVDVSDKASDVYP